MKVDQDVMVAQLRDLSFVIELETAEAVLALNGP